MKLTHWIERVFERSINSFKLSAFLVPSVNDRAAVSVFIVEKIFRKRFSKVFSSLAAAFGVLLLAGLLL